ncbi:MAG: glycosyltransferase family 39 protein [Gemmatimonadales bacterium]|nr:glycosyltransferase family 39 protein [Gemmatimonadales bacterium]
MDPTGQGERAPAWPLAVALAWGVALRVVLLLSGRSLWIDEARLALNIGTRSFLHLLAPLDYDQTAPVAFLWIERLAVAVFGMHDWTLQLLPFLAGIGVLFLIYPLARRAGLSQPAAVLATAIVACAPNLIFYASAVKPYGVDVLVTCLLLLISLDVLDPYGDPRSRSGLVAAGVLAPWCSAPAVFVLGAIGLALFAEARRARRDLTPWLVKWVAASAASFGLAYLLVYRNAATNPYMLVFWREAFLNPGPGWLIRVALRIREAVWGMFLEGSTRPTGQVIEELAYTLIPAVLLVLAGLGVVRLARARPAPALLVAGPMALALLASLAGVYPTATRLLLFAAPLFAILVAAGLAQVLSWRVEEPAPWIWPLATLLVVMGPAFYGLRLVLRAPAQEPMAAVARRFAVSAAPGDAVYLAPGSIPAWTLYTTRWIRPDTARLARVATLASSAGPAFENAPPGSFDPSADTAALSLDHDGRLELLGRSAGIQERPGLPVRPPSPDDGWVEGEVARIAGSGRPAMWLVLSYLYGFERDVLAALEAEHGRCTYRERIGDIELVRYELPSPHRSR